jgi:DNA-binding NarL/FixJ family response regulator
MKRLTERELEVVELLFNGLTNKEIGENYISLFIRLKLF